MSDRVDLHESKATQLRAIALIEPLIPPDAEERVRATVKRFNSIVRGHIRTETGLRLSDDEEKGAAVPVVVAAGLSAGVAGLIDSYRDPTLWRLIMAQPKLGGVVEGLSTLLKHWHQFDQWPELPDIAKGSRSSLERSTQVAIALQVLAVTRKVFDGLKQIHEDILGTYRMGLPSCSHRNLLDGAGAFRCGIRGSSRGPYGSYSRSRTCARLYADGSRH
jgi:hypothetical protein